MSIKQDFIVLEKLMDSKITVKVKYSTDTVFEIEVATDATVLQLKELIAEKSKVPANEQKIIFKGKIELSSPKLSRKNLEGQRCSFQSQG